MPVATRTFRVFVSSTFEDLKQERDALQRDVFPKLRKLCEQHGARFQAIDLRWGVRDEAALDQQTMEICLREIERCQRTGIKPNFIVLLGDRYGWRPLPARIEAKELESLLAAVSEEDRRSLVWQEGQPAADTGWYRLDENAVSPEYVLRPRELQVSAEASKEEHQSAREQGAKAWATTENRLRGILLAAIARLGWAADDPRRIKYEASATHQEILKGLGTTEADRRHVFGFFRRPTGQTDARLEDLKAYLRARLPGNIVEFDPDDIAKLCEAVFAHLRQVIEWEVKRFGDRPALDLEVEAHDRFAEDRSRIFTGRQAVLEAIGDYIRGPDPRPLVLYGESGSGKSAVMAKASQQYNGPGRVIRRFIGASPESANGHALLTSLCRQIAPGETPVDYAQLEKTFKERLTVATAEQPLVFFIDALDQLAAGDPARDVTWLPSELLPHVKVMISTTADAERLPEGLAVQIERMTQSEGGDALEEWLREAGRTLQPWQREKVLAHFGRCGLPLYLKLAAEESKLWKSYAPREECTLREGVAGVIDTLLERLASNANHGPTLVERSLGYLAAARYGLTEDEMLDVLTSDDAVWNDFDQRKHHDVSGRRLPVVVWSRLSLDLEPYLTERAAPGGTVLNFFHRQLAEQATERFLAGESERHKHEALARYFNAQPTWLNLDLALANARQLSELPYQQTLSQEWKSLSATLRDPSFAARKILACGPISLLEDFERAMKHLADSHLTSLFHALRQVTHHITATRTPSEIASCLHIRLNHIYGRMLESLERAPFTPFLGGWSALPDVPPQSLLYTIYYPGFGLSIDDSTDRLIAGGDEQLAAWNLSTGVQLFSVRCQPKESIDCEVSPNGQFILGVIRSFYPHATITAWNANNGSGRFTLCYDNCAKIGPDGSFILTWMDSGHGSIRIWDARTGDLRGDVPLPTDCKWPKVVVAQDSRHLLVVTERKIWAWDLPTTKQLYELDEDILWRPQAFISPDSSYFLVPDRSVVVMRRLPTGTYIKDFRFIDEKLAFVAASPDGRFVAATYRDTTFVLWDAYTGERILSNRLMSSTLTNFDVVFSPDSEVMVVYGHLLFKLLSAVTGEELNVLPVGEPGLGDESVSGVAFSRDSKILVTRSESTIQAWDIALAKNAVHRVADCIPHKLVGFSKDGCYLVCTTNGGLSAFDTTTKTSAPDYSAPFDASTEVAFEQIGDQLRIRDSVANLEWVLPLTERVDHIRAVALSPDRSIAAAATDMGGFYESDDACGYTDYTSYLPAQDFSVRVWKTQSGNQTMILRGHQDSINGVAINPNGRLVASVAKDCTLRVWEIGTGKCIATFGAAGELYECVWHPDSAHLAVRGKKGIYWLRWTEGTTFSPDDRRNGD